MKLLAAYASVSEVLNAEANNVFGDIIMEELKLTLRGRTKINRDTILTLLQVCLPAPRAFSFLFIYLFKLT